MIKNDKRIGYVKNTITYPILFFMQLCYNENAEEMCRDSDNCIYRSGVHRQYEAERLSLPARKNKSGLPGMFRERGKHLRQVPGRDAHAMGNR